MALVQPEGFSPAPLVDIGANLTHSSLLTDLEGVLERARSAGVYAQLVTGTDLEHSRQAIELAAKHPGELYATAGVHPHDAKSVGGDWQRELKALIERPEVHAAGEMGLDFNRDYSPRPIQEEVFEAQLELAAATGKPAFLHERDTDGRFFDILEPWLDRLSGAVLHCFTGTREALHRALDLDLHLGITGWICDERRGADLQQGAAEIPANRLLVETDAPYLLPRTIRPRQRTRRNEPGWLPWVVHQLAECRGQTPDEIARITTDNAIRLLRIAPPL